MEYRTGKCSSCGAEYKVPASFAHNVARCKVCQGVVHLGAPGAPAPEVPASTPPAAAAPTPPAPKPQPVPARKVAPRPEEPKRPAAAAPTPRPKTPSAPRPAAAAAAEGAASGEGKRAGSTLERLKAERASHAAAVSASGAGAMKAAPKAGRLTPKGGAPGPRLGASTTPARSAPARGGRRAKAGARAGAEGDADGGRARRRPEKKSLALPLAAIAGLVVIGAGVWFFRDALFGDGGSSVSAGETAPAAPATPNAGSEAPAEETDELTPPTPPTDEESADAGDGTGDAEAAAMPPKAQAADSGKDPASVDLAAIEDFGPAPGTEPGLWETMNEQMATYMDLDEGAAGMRAGLKLEEQGREAVPVILNHMKTLDFSTDEGFRKGDMCQKTLERICNGNNFGWKYSTEPADVYFNKRVVESWVNQWVKAKDNVEYWIKMAKLDERDPERAAELRATLGTPADDLPDVPVPDAGGGDIDPD
jgi:hypothetical protein